MIPLHPTRAAIPVDAGRTNLPRITDPFVLHVHRRRAVR